MTDAAALFDLPTANPSHPARYGRNAELRVEYESVILFELTSKAVQ